MDPLTHCLERLHLGDNTKLLERAKQYHSQCASKVPVKVFKGPNSQHVISIQLAYESLGLYDWNIKLAPELAGCSPKAYNTTMSAVRKLLDLQSTITFDTLGVTFGSTAMATHAQDLWMSFVQKHISQLGPAQQVSAKEQLESALWKAAAFYVCAKSLGVQIDSTKLQTLCTCGSVEFKKSVRLIQQKCETEITKLKTHSTTFSRPSRKRKSTTTTTSTAAVTATATRTRTRTTKSIGKDEDSSEDDDDDNSVDERGKSRTTAMKRQKIAEQSKTTPENSSNKKPTNITTGTSKLPSVIPKEKSVLLKKTPTKKRGAVSGIVSMINLQDYRTSKKYKDYLQWERQIKEQLS